MLPGIGARRPGIQRERGKPSFAVMASPDAGGYVAWAFVALPRGQRHRLCELAEAGDGKAPTGYQVKQNFPAEWIRPKLLGRALHLHGEDRLLQARLVEIVAQAATRTLRLCLTPTSPFIRGSGLNAKYDTRDGTF